MTSHVIGEVNRKISRRKLQPAVVVFRQVSLPSVHLTYLIKFICGIRTTRPRRRQTRSLGQSGVRAVDKKLRSVPNLTTTNQLQAAAQKASKKEKCKSLNANYA